MPCGIITGRTYKDEVMDHTEIMVIFIEIRAQGSVVHPRDDDGWCGTKVVTNS